MIIDHYEKQLAPRWNSAVFVYFTRSLIKNKVATSVRQG